MKYSIVVPCYNEQGNIIKLVEEFTKVNDVLRESGFELILVNNGSKDNTRKEIIECTEKYDFVHLVQVDENQGYGYGILQGMKACKGKYIGWIHADLQFSPSLFINIAQRIDSGVDNSEHIYYKGLRKNRPFADKFFTFGMSCFETLYLRKSLWDINAQPTLMSRELFDNALNPPYGFALDLYFYYSAKKANYSIHRFDSIQKEREVGESSWNTGISARVKLIKRTLSDSREMKR